MTYKIRMLIIDPACMLPEATVSKLRRSNELCLFGAPKSWEYGVKFFEAQIIPDVVLYSVLSASNLDAAFGFLTQYNLVVKSILMVRDEDDPMLLYALIKGTNGYLKSSATAAVIHQAVMRIYRGEAVLSPNILTKILDQIQERSY